MYSRYLRTHTLYNFLHGRSSCPDHDAASKSNNDGASSPQRLFLLLLLPPRPRRRPPLFPDAALPASLLPGRPRARPRARQVGRRHGLHRQGVVLQVPLLQVREGMGALRPQARIRSVVEIEKTLSLDHTTTSGCCLVFFYRQEVLLRQHGGGVLPLRLLQVQARIRIQGIRQVPLAATRMPSFAFSKCNVRAK